MMKNNFNKFILFITALLLSNSAVIAATKAQSELKSFGLKFIHIVIGVVISVVIIYLGLLFYKRLRNPYIQKFANRDAKNSLLSSENLDDAIEHFIKDSE